MLLEPVSVGCLPSIASLTSAYPAIARTSFTVTFPVLTIAPCSNSLHLYYP
jgi:hypothetical protein